MNVKETIKTLKQYTPIVSKKYNMFFDETNNFRKLYLTEHGANNKFENMYFILGGIAFTNKPDFEELKKDLKTLKCNL